MSDKDSTPEGGGDSTGQDKNMDTFDNPVNDPTQFGGDGGDPSPVTRTQSKSSEKSDVKALEVQEDSFDEKPKEKEEKKVDEPPKEEEKKVEDTGRYSKRKIKAVDGSDAYDLNPDMQIKVKVDGKTEMVPLADLRDSYSGAKSLEQRHNDISQKEAQYREEFTTYQNERAEIETHFKEIAKLLDDPQGDPLNALNYLIDMTGRNKYDYNRRIMEAKLAELDQLQLMSDVERAKYFLEKENSYLKERQELSRKAMAEKSEHEQFVRQVEKMREGAGVNPEDFQAAYNDLLELGDSANKLTAEDVIAYAVSLPAVARAEEITAAIDRDLLDDDELVLQIAEYIKTNPEVDNQEIIELIGAELGVPKEIKVLKKKMIDDGDDPYVPKKKEQKEDHVETFDDFDPYYTQR